jgi:hypothetical protein
LRVAVGAAAGALIGITLSATVAATVGAGASEQPGYGGDAGRLQVRVDGASIHVRGSGYLAGSTVSVQVGAVSAEIVADTFGNIDAVLEATADGASGDASATGTSADGAAVMASTALERPPSSAAGATTLLAALVGAGVPLLLDRRRERAGLTDRQLAAVGASANC